ncbi:MAG: hypothetical protein CVU40_17615 [Chloroflexi bacterium HGW-Chloroflexi-2]|jgi:hypothetical protein|nr:MAG: hypothetical protein CVU40_17615 [Chloroflexi bacterium HGW-Chloroflexi-2]
MLQFKRFLTFCLLLSVVIPLFTVDAQSEIPREPLWLAADTASEQGSVPQTEVQTVDSHTLGVTIIFSGVWAQLQTGDGQSYTRLWHDEYSSYREPGQPALPGVTFNILVPQGAQVEVIQHKSSSHSVSLPRQGLPTKIIPAQRQASKSEPPPPWTPPDPVRYASFSLQPQRWYEVNDTFQMRDYTILPLWINPVRYRPANGEIELLERIELRLTWPENSATSLDAALVSDSPSFDRLVSQIVINPPPQATMDVTKTGEGYLIVTPNQFYEEILSFSNYKQSQGYFVTVAKLSDIGSSINDIKAYITDAYNNLTPRPTYLLLVGDTMKDPTTYLLPATSGLVTGRSTDLYYATMDGNGDFVPDIFVGRLPGRTESEITNIVNKIINYSNNSFQDWQINSSFISTCDRLKDSDSDFYHYEIAEFSHNFVIDEHTSLLGYPSYFPLENPISGGDKLYCVTNSATTANVNNSIIAGRGLITYSGHGSIDGWYDGSIVVTRADIPIIAPIDISSFVASFACYTNDYGNESVSFPAVFGETWMLQENKGSIAFLGSAAPSYWDQDKELEIAFYNSLFSNPLQPPTISEAMHFGLTEVHRIFLNETSGSPKYYWETYNLLGDPSQKLWLYPDSEYYFIAKAPVREDEGLITNIVHYSVTITNYGSTDEFLVTVEPTEWLTVTNEIGEILSKTAETLWVSVQIPYGTAPDQFDEVEVTISSEKSTQTTSFTFKTTALQTYFSHLPVLFK